MYMFFLHKKLNCNFYKRNIDIINNMNNTNSMSESCPAPKQERDDIPETHPFVSIGRVSGDGTVMNHLYKYAILFVFYSSHIIIYHYSSILHATYCTPSTWIGLLRSPFVATSPHCVAFQWIIYYGGIYIRSIWMILGMFFVHMYLSWNTLNLHSGLGCPRASYPK